MKKILLSYMLLILVAVCEAQAYDQKTPYITKSFSESINNVEARTQGGSITVTGGSSGSRIEVYISPNGNKSLSKEEIDSRLKEDYELNISVSGGKLVAISKQKNSTFNWKRALSISYKIYVPQNVSTDLNTSGGSIDLTNLNGTQDFRTSGGSLTVKQVSGKIMGQTSGGSITVSDSKDDIDLHTSGGSIDATNCAGKITLETSGGSLDLKGLKGTIRAGTSGGSVDGRTIDGELITHTSGGSIDLKALTCSLETSTSGGSIDVEITELRQYVKIRNSGGHIGLSIPKNKGVDLKLNAEKIKTDALSNFSGSMEEHEVYGKLNGGGVPVTVDAGGGRISLTVK
jgi:hypothetical protein